MYSNSVIAHAEHLEKLMEQMNRQIREVHLRIVAFDWYIGKHCRYGTELNKVQSGNTDDLNSCINTSKIGVINEILQMYGNTAQTSAITTTLDTITTITTTMTNTITEADCLVVSENLTNEILSGADSVTPPTTTSVNVIATDCLAKFAGATGNTVATNTHIRQPVFYIG